METLFWYLCAPWPFALQFIAAKRAHSELNLAARKTLESTKRCAGDVGVVRGAKGCLSNAVDATP